MKKRRKAKTVQHGSREHLDKVGTNSHAAAVHEQQRERQAVMDTMGLGGAGSVGKVLAWIVIGIITVVAIVALVIWTVI